MHIAMLSWESMHSVALGGLAPHVTELSAGLSRLGHDIHVFTRMGEKQSRYDSIGGVHYHRCPFQHSDDFITYVGRMCDSFVWHLAETEHFLGRPFDVVHGHDWLATPAIARIKNTHRRPIVMTVHSTEFGRCGNSHWDDPMSRRIRDLEWEGTYVADRVIGVSKTLVRETQECYGVPADKMVSVYNGVNVTKYDGPVDTREVRARHEVGDDDPCVLFAGRMTWQKGPDILLEAVPGVVAQNPRLKLLFAGDGDMRPGLETRATAIGVDSSTRFLGHRSGSDLVGLFRSSDVICVPSRNEPFGIVILEAWSASKPVLTTRTGGPVEFVRDDYNGLTVETGIETIGEGLRSLLADRDGARRMGSNGRRDAESRFTWDHAAVATEAVYQSIAGPGASITTPVGGNGQEVHTMARQKMDIPTVRPPNPRSPGDGRSAGQMMEAKGPRPTEEQVRQRAHEIFLARNGSPGDPVADWLQAERELRESAALKLGKLRPQRT